MGGKFERVMGRAWEVVASPFRAANARMLRITKARLIRQMKEEEQDELPRSAVRRSIILCVLLIPAIFASDFAGIISRGDPMVPALIAGPATVFVGVLAGTAVLGPIRRSWAYKRGYEAGRESIFASLSEAVTRGIRFSEWYFLEAEREAMRRGYADDPEFLAALRDARKQSR